MLEVVDVIQELQDRQAVRWFYDFVKSCEVYCDRLLNSGMIAGLLWTIEQ
jgi:hypothetical protein